MNTFLSPAQEALLEQYKSFAAEVVGPIAKDLEDHKACLRELLQMFGQKGYLGISVPREYGGQGQSFLHSILFVEACAQQEAGLALSLACHQAVIEVLKKFGSDNQRSRYLPLLGRGEVLGTLAFTEEQAGTDVFAVQTEARPSTDYLVLEGKKALVVNAELSGLYLVLARFADEHALLLCDHGPNPSIACGPNRPHMGLKSARANDLEFKSTQLNCEARVLSREGTRRVVEFANDVAKVVLSAGAVGMLRTCLHMAVEHARKREQFGSSIGQFQGIQWKLADMLTESTGAALQVYRAAWALEQSPDQFSTFAAMAKLISSRTARIHTGEAIQITGAVGLSEQLPLERFYRDAKAMEICLGTSEAQKIQLVTELRI